jgi:hypothetical protein
MSEPEAIDPAQRLRVILAKAEGKVIPAEFGQQGPPEDIPETDEPPAGAPALPPDEFPGDPAVAAVNGDLNGNALILASTGGVRASDTAARLFSGLARTKKHFRKGGVFAQLGPLEKGRRGLILLGSTDLRTRIERHFKLWVWRMVREQPVLRPDARCSDDLAKLLLKTEEFQLLPPINTVAAAPLAVEGINGGLQILGPGYHAHNGGVFVTGGSVRRDVSLAEAVSFIKGLFAEFDFQTPADRSRAIANLLSPAFSFGGFIDGWIPVDVAEADQSQAGKGLRQRLVVSIYQETAYVIAPREGGVGSLDESLSQGLVAGKPFIRFDNVRGPFASQLLESLITEGVGAARVPHYAEVQVQSRGFYFQLTSNGVDTTRDFANRSCIVRIRKRVGYRYQRYPEGNLEAHVKANAPFYLGCVFAVLREWLARGKPMNHEEVRHDSREWAAALDWIVQKLFGEAPLLDGHEVAQQRVSNPARNFARALCLATEKQGRLDEPLQAADFVDLLSSEGVKIPGLKEGNEEDAKRQIGIQLGRAFGPQEQCEIEIDGFLMRRWVEQRQRLDEGGLSKGYWDAKIYRIWRV